jgi:NAD(P)-dependent dehydrogenase (short-subunit alcohol dehydrogenase family)
MMRAAIVTGASGGIGLAIVRVLGSSGYAVTVTGRRPEKLAATVEMLHRESLEVHSIAGDVSDSAFIEELVRAHRNRFGRLDVLVNNAGVGIGAPLSKLRERDVDLQLSVNVRSVVLMYRAALPLLRASAAEHRNALVINLASLGGKRPEPIVSVYSAAKAAVIAFSAAMNRELGPQGIKSTALCPAFVNTEMTAWIRDKVPAAEMIDPQDVAGAVAWLLSTGPQCVVPEIVLTRPGDVL